VEGKEYILYIEEIKYKYNGLTVELLMTVMYMHDDINVQYLR
jgi:hypothetical protein